MIDVDDQLRALSQDLDDRIGDHPRPFEHPRRSLRPLLAAVVVLAVLAGGGALATTRGHDDLDVATVPAPEGSTDSTATPPSTLPRATTLVDPPVVEGRPLRLGLDRSGAEAIGASDECVLDGPRTWPCGNQVRTGFADPLPGGWQQLFRADPAVPDAIVVALMGITSTWTGDFASGAIGPVDVPDGVGYLLVSSTESITRVGWTRADGTRTLAQIVDRPRAEALALIGGLRPRATYGYDLPSGTGLVPVLESERYDTDPAPVAPSAVTYAVPGGTVRITVWPGDRRLLESILFSNAPVPITGVGGATMGVTGIVSVRGHPASVWTVPADLTGTAGAPTGTADAPSGTAIFWYEPERGAIVRVSITNDVAAADPVGLEVLDDLLELDEAAFQAVVARTPVDRPGS